MAVDYNNDAYILWHKYTVFEVLAILIVENVFSQCIALAIQWIWASVWAQLFFSLGVIELGRRPVYQSLNDSGSVPDNDTHSWEVTMDYMELVWNLLDYLLNVLESTNCSPKTSYLSITMRAIGCCVCVVMYIVIYPKILNFFN